MGKILVTYHSGYGATAAAAKIIAETLTEKGFKVDLCIISLEDLAKYDAVIIGSPIRFGRCTLKTKRFIKRNLGLLKGVKVAFFFTCMSITANEPEQNLPVYIDSSFNDPDKPNARMRAMEDTHTVSYYLKHFLKIIPEIRPLNVAFFKGCLNTEIINPFHRLIMMFAMFTLPEIKTGDFLNPVGIRAWTESLFDKIKTA